MKYTTLIAILLAIDATNSEEATPKRKNVTVYVSSNNFNSASNRIDGHETANHQPPIVYRLVTQEQPRYLPAPTTPSIATPQTPLQPSLLQESSVPTPTLPPPTIRTPNTQPALETNNSPQPSWQLPSVGEMLTSFKNTACSLNPYTITAGALVALYATYLIKLYNTSYKVMKKNTWASWKEHIPVEVMLEVPHQEVAEELFNAIKAKYLPVHGADLMTPIVKFNNAVDHELAQLNQFIRIHEWLNYTKLGYIFPKQEIELVQAHTKIKRLVFLKDVLLAWMSDYSSAIMHDKFIPRFQQQRVQQLQPEYVSVVTTNTIECI